MTRSPSDEHLARAYMAKLERDRGLGYEPAPSFWDTKLAFILMLTFITVFITAGWIQLYQWAKWIINLFR